jgi:hypothetical protein
MDATSQGPTPANATEVDYLSDVDGDDVLVTTPGDPDDPIAVAGFEGSWLAAPPISLIRLRPDQAIELGKALLRAGYAKQASEQPHGVQSLDDTGAH